MLRRSWQAVPFLVALAFAVADAPAAAPHHRGTVANYLFGGYGPGPFGCGDFSYAGSTSHTVTRHRELVPSFTTRVAHRTCR